MLKWVNTYIMLTDNSTTNYLQRFKEILSKNLFIYIYKFLVIIKSYRASCEH